MRKDETIAIEMVKEYLGNDYTGKYQDLEEIVNNMTGAQIKELAQSCFAYAA